jgi:hypothetical protein
MAASQRLLQAIFGDQRDIMGDLTWIFYGISLGEVNEIFVGDSIKDKSGYLQDIAGRSILEM